MWIPILLKGKCTSRYSQRFQRSKYKTKSKNKIIKFNAVKGLPMAITLDSSRYWLRIVNYAL